MENISSLERIEKIHGIILVSEDSNSKDQASRRLETTLVPEDSSSKDQNNENLDMIDALDGIDGLNGSKDLLWDYPGHISGGILASKLADINDEGEVNSGTSVVKILENGQEAPVTPSSLSLIVVPTSNINNFGIVPICSSMSGLPLGITEDSSLLKDVFREAMTNRIDVEMAIFSSLENKTNQLAFQLDKIRDELQTRKENLDKMEEARITLELAQIKNIANMEFIDQERKTLEYNFLHLVESD
ncbi:hypothetical protein Adt_41512 [Abeliophyllum distichum]|uniref:Uncharacterized protein n=1 Tax=Abeliophyllum distichum TaxID=126358 RepID=A0ABD1PP26_9LAMI